jgi:threonine/homoserine/homoserine lactone efflux protein
VSITFLVTALIVVVTPGTGVLYTLSAALSHGRRASVVAAFGCTLGTVPHLAAAITGLAALLQASAPAFHAVTYLGVVYLLVLAWATWRDRSALVVDRAAAPRSDGRVILTAVLVNLLNPKPTLFFVAFLPQFVPPDAPDATPRMLGYGAVFMLLTFVIFTGYGVFAAGVRGKVLDRPRLTVRLRRVFAVSFLALGVKLALTNG